MTDTLRFWTMAALLGLVGCAQAEGQVAEGRITETFDDGRADGEISDLGIDIGENVSLGAGRFVPAEDAIRYVATVELGVDAIEASYVSVSSPRILVPHGPARMGRAQTRIEVDNPFPTADLGMMFSYRARGGEWQTLSVELSTGDEHIQSHVFKTLIVTESGADCLTRIDAVERTGATGTGFVASCALAQADEYSIVAFPIAKREWFDVGSIDVGVTVDDRVGSTAAEWRLE